MEAILRAKQFRAQNYQGEPVSVWHRVPVARRASVFVLLFLGHLGELRVVLTKRSSQLRNFPGHISLPGGKADTGLESPWMVSRRETDEEIGLCSDDSELLDKHGLEIDFITDLPCYLSRTFSAVKPCVGFMRMAAGESEDTFLQSLKLRVNPGESSSIFSCPLRDFLYPGPDAKEALQRSHQRVKWGGIPWNLRSYTFPQHNPAEVHWLQGHHDLSASESEGEEFNLGDDEARMEVSTEDEGTSETHREGSADYSASVSHELSDKSQSDVSESTNSTATSKTCSATPSDATSELAIAESAIEEQKGSLEVVTPGSAQEPSVDATPETTPGNTVGHGTSTESISRKRKDDQSSEAAAFQSKKKKNLSEWGNLGSRRDSVTNEKIYDVWGLTANILHDLAEIAYLSPSERTPNRQYGEEELIWSVWHYGQQMRTKERSDIESALISAKPSDPVSFGDVVPRSEFNRLKRIYKI
ncbi:hypothetical protein OY671_004047 [Metschnikowia pulcherrima]|nr:hypothetical protein OY671_004047 [Metschnikowia pulcherrima]